MRPHAASLSGSGGAGEGGLRGWKSDAMGGAFFEPLFPVAPFVLVARFALGGGLVGAEGVALLDLMDGELDLSLDMMFSVCLFTVRVVRVCMSWYVRSRKTW